eukprot:333291-Amphidinium_carterae.1
MSCRRRLACHLTTIREIAMSMLSITLASHAVLLSPNRRTGSMTAFTTCGRWSPSTHGIPTPWRRNSPFNALTITCMMR